MALELNPTLLKEVEAAIYQVRWVDAYSKMPTLATDAEIAQIAVETVYKYLTRTVL